MLLVLQATDKRAPLTMSSVHSTYLPLVLQATDKRAPLTVSSVHCSYLLFVLQATDKRAFIPGNYSLAHHW